MTILKDILGEMGKSIFHPKVDEITIMENTKAAQDKYGRLFGADHVIFTEEHIKALKEGKQLAFNDSEYVTFISMSELEG